MSDYITDEAGWIFNGEITIWKDPQAQSTLFESLA